MGTTTFVSYAREDSAFARRLCGDLRASGFDVWLDQLDIRAGDPWDQAVEASLKQSGAVIVILSPSSVASRSVLDEVSYALDSDKRVLPVLLERCDVPLRLRRLHYMDFTDDYDVGLADLIRSLSPAGVAPPPVKQNAARVPKRERLLGAMYGGVGGALYGAVAEWLIFVNDDRNIPLQIPMVAGGLIAGILFAIAGSIAARRLATWNWIIASNVIVVVTWVAVFGTYEDVVSASVLFGGPPSAIIAAIVHRIIANRRAT